MTTELAPAAVPTPPAPPATDVTDGLGPSDADIIKAYQAKQAPAAEPAPQAAPQAQAVPGGAQAPEPAPAGSPDLEARLREYAQGASRDVQAQLEQKRAAQAQLAELEATRAELAALRAGLREDPLAVVSKEGGYDFEALAKRAIGQGTPESVEIRRIRDEVAQLRSARDAEAKAAAEREQARQQSDLRDRWRATVVPTLEAKRASYEHVLTMMDPEELKDAVATVVQRVYDYSNGVKVLSIEEAAALLEQQAQQRLERIRPLVQKVAQPVSSSSSRPAGVPGLTNAQTQSAPPDEDPEDISDAALNARALRFARERGYSVPTR